MRRGRILAVGAVRASGMVKAIRPGRLAAFVLDSLGQRGNPSLVLRFHSFNTPDKEALVQGRGPAGPTRSSRSA